MENTFLPKWLVNSLGALLVIFVALLIIQQSYSLQLAVKNEKPANTISVSGDGQLTGTPDLASVNMGVLSQGKDAATVKDQNNTKINQLTDFLKKQGISAADITTSNFNFNTVQTYPNVFGGGGMPTISGYQGNQTVTVKVHGVDKDQTVLNKIVGEAVNNGANEIDGVSLSFEKSTLDALQQQAQQKAIDAARTKAKGLASEAGLTLGKVVSISETNSRNPGPIPYAMDAAQGLGGAMAKSVSPNIQNGTQDITETMTVVFEVK